MTNLVSIRLTVKSPDPKDPDRKMAAHVAVPDLNYDEVTSELRGLLIKWAMSYQGLDGAVEIVIKPNG